MPRDHVRESRTISRPREGAYVMSCPASSPFAFGIRGSGGTVTGALSTLSNVSGIGFDDCCRGQTTGRFLSSLTRLWTLVPSRLRQHIQYTLSQTLG